MAGSIRGGMAGENHFPKMNRAAGFLNSPVENTCRRKRMGYVETPLRTGAQFFLFERRASADPEKVIVCRIRRFVFVL